MIKYYSCDPAHTISNTSANSLKLYCGGHLPHNLVDCLSYPPVLTYWPF